MITLSGLDVESMKLGQIINAATLYDDPGLRGLLNVAPPQLVHPSEQLIGAPPAIGSWKTNRGWPAAKPSSSSGGRQPSSRSRLRVRGRFVVDLIRHCLAQPCHPLVSDRSLDRFAPPPGDCSRADPDAEAPAART